MRAAAIVCLLAGACGGLGDDCQDDPGARHHAVNPATGACWEFESSCEVPSAWASCTENCPPLTCPDDYLPDPDTCMCVPIDACTGCFGDQDCAEEQHCDLTLPPMCPADDKVEGDQAPQGTCVDDPSPFTVCQYNLDCGSGEVCPAHYGFCGLMTEAPVPPICEAYCEKACWGDRDCAADEHCNAFDLTNICVTPNPKPIAPRKVACAGWCVPR